MLHFERFIQMFSLIMLETLKKLWSITYRATHQLQNYFGPVTAPRESELDINALIRSLYYREEIPEFIIPLFFVIPKAFEKMPDENVLKMIRCLACPLVEQLPWLKKTPDLQVHESTIDEQKISAYIHQ